MSNDSACDKTLIYYVKYSQELVVISKRIGGVSLMSYIAILLELLSNYLLQLVLARYSHLWNISKLLVIYPLQEQRSCIIDYSLSISAV